VVFDEENNKRLRSLEYQHAKAFVFIAVSMTVTDVPVNTNPSMTPGIIWVATLHLTSKKGACSSDEFSSDSGNYQEREGTEAEGYENSGNAQVDPTTLKQLLLSLVFPVNTPLSPVV